MRKPRWTRLLCGLALLPAAAATLASDPDAATTAGGTPHSRVLSYADIVAKAKDRAGQPYEAPAEVPAFLAELTPAELDRLRFKPERALWHGSDLPFRAMFYHPGSYYRHAVALNRVDDSHVAPIVFDKDNFIYPNANQRYRVPDDLGYAGFKLLHELDKPGKRDEVVSFLGASYFRGLGADEHYGLSARGLAIDTATAQGEEFPAFTDFWLVRPEPGDHSLVVFALLDTPALAGGYRFVITPGQATRTHVEMTLFTRHPIQKLGIAPLTSMFAWGENSLHRLDDYRPEAHDSDGLLVAEANGEWLWRPLVNPQSLRVDDLTASNVRGFGLLQRDRVFDHYQALDYEYEKRPNAWIKPQGSWGQGHLELIQIPSDSEVNDNIALFWKPDKPVTGGQRLHYSYDITWSEALAGPDSLGHTAATRIGRTALAPGEPRDTIRVAIEFVGGRLTDLTQHGAVKPRVNAMRDATLNNIQVQRNPHTDGWRLSFLVPEDALDTRLDLRAFLADAQGGALTETWSYALKP